MNKTSVSIFSFLVLCAWTLVLALYLYMKGYTLAVELTALWFFGTLLSCVRKIPLGFLGDLEFRGFHAATWETGYSLIIPIWPVPLVVNRYIMRMKTRPMGAEVGGKTRMVHEESFHYMDTREAQKKVVVETGVLGLASISTFQELRRVLFDVDHPSHFIVLSLPFMVVFYILLGGSFVSSKLNSYATVESGNEMSIAVGLQKIQKPLYPLREMYVKSGNEKVVEYELRNNIRYYFHPATEKDDYTVHVIVKANACYMVIAGESIVFQTEHRPVYVANMEVLAEYTPKTPYLPWYIKAFGPPENWRTKGIPMLLMRERAGWRYLYSHWDKVDTRHNIVGTALPQKEISEKAGGGLVCF
jgi:hypothetical protein